MFRRLRRPGVIPSVMLTIIVLWALLAVLMLTNTLVAAQQIDNRVGVINGEVGPIDNELDSVVLAGSVATATDQIRPAAAPLTGQLTQTNDSVTRIDASAEEILASAELINGSVKEINASVQQINGNVNSIGSTLDSVESNATSINESVDGITASFSGTLSEVVSIDDGAAGINRRAETVIGQSRGIAADLAEVTNEHVPAIMTNAAAIENSPLLLNELDAAEVLTLNQLAAAQLAPELAGQEAAAPLPVPDVAELPVPVQRPVQQLGGILRAGPQQSPDGDTGSILGGLAGGL